MAQPPLISDRIVHESARPRMTKRLTLRSLLPVLALAFMVTACSQNAGQKQQLGTVAGAGLGALLGSQMGEGSGKSYAIAGGAILGALLGGQIGAELDAADRQQLGRAQQAAYTAPIGDTISWNNPDSGNRGTVTPVRDGYAEGGRYCREYRHEIIVDGRRETAVGTACQNADGTWQVVS